MIIYIPRFLRDIDKRFEYSEYEIEIRDMRFRVYFQDTIFDSFRL